MFLLFIIFILVFDKKIEAIAIEKLQSSTAGDLYIEEIDINWLKNFPHATVIVSGLQINDSIYNAPFLKLSRLQLKLNVLSYLKGSAHFSEVVLQDGSLSVYYTKDDRLNTQGIFAPGEGKKTLEVDDIELRNIHFQFVDSFYYKFHAFTFLYFNIEVTEEKIHTKGEVLFDSLVFKPYKGGFFMSKAIDFDVHFLNTGTEIKIEEKSKLEVDDEEFSIAGVIALFHDTPSLFIEITNPETGFETGKSLVNKNIQNTLNKINIDKPVHSVLQLKGTPIRNNPLAVDYFFRLQNAAIEAPPVSLQNCDVAGHYINHLDTTIQNDPANSALYIEKINGNYKKIPLRITGQLTNLTDPFADVTLTTSAPATSFNTILSRNVKFAEGDIEVFVQYKGKLKIAEHEENVSAKVSLKNGSVNTSGKELARNIQAYLLLQENTLLINKFNMYVAGSNVVISGKIPGIISSVLNKQSHLQSEIIIRSDVLYVNKLLDLVSATEKEPTGKQLFKKISLYSEKVLYKKLVADNFSMIIRNASGNLNVDTMKARIGEGTINMSFSGMKNCGWNDCFSFQAQLQNIDVPTLLNGFENFNQDKIAARNIEGTIQADIQFSGEIKNKKMDPFSLQGKGNYALYDGELHNVTLIEQAGKFMLKDKDLTHVHFADIYHKFEIKDGDIHIDEMRLKSDVFTVYIDGIYSWQNNTELTLEVPLKTIFGTDTAFATADTLFTSGDIELSNLSYLSDAINESYDKKGLSIFFTATEEEDKLKVKPLLFPKRKKEQLNN